MGFVPNIDKTGNLLNNAVKDTRDSKAFTFIVINTLLVLFHWYGYCQIDSTPYDKEKFEILKLNQRVLHALHISDSLVDSNKQKALEHLSSFLDNPVLKETRSTFDNPYAQLYYRLSKFYLEQG